MQAGRLKDRLPLFTPEMFLHWHLRLLSPAPTFVICHLSPFRVTLHYTGMYLTWTLDRHVHLRSCEWQQKTVIVAFIAFKIKAFLYDVTSGPRHMSLMICIQKKTLPQQNQVRPSLCASFSSVLSLVNVVIPLVKVPQLLNLSLSLMQILFLNRSFTLHEAF